MAVLKLAFRSRLESKRFLLVPAAYQQSNISSHCGVCLLVCGQSIFCKKLTPVALFTGSTYWTLLRLKNTPKRYFCKKLTPGGSVHRKFL